MSLICWGVVKKQIPYGSDNEKSGARTKEKGRRCDGISGSLLRREARVPERQVHQPRVWSRFFSSMAAAARPFMVPVTDSLASARICGLS
jgi:hypothetical protein